MNDQKNKITMKRIKTFLTVVIALLFVSASAQNDISGQLLYHDSTGAPLPDVQLELYDSEGNYISTAYTNNNGEYIFNDVAVGTYNIEPSYDAQAGGVDMGDANLILLNLLGLYEFTPIEELASDVDADGEVTWDDYWFIIINHFIFGEDFPAGDWVFEDITATVGAKEGGDGATSDYGNSAGDVQGSWEPGQRNKPFVEATHKDYNLNEGITNTVEITMNNAVTISGTGLVINYPSDAINVIDAGSALPGAEIAIDNGQIRMAWAAQSAQLTSLDKNYTLLTLEVETLHELAEPAKFILSNESHFAGEQGTILKDANVQLPVINQNQNSLVVERIYPNPVTSVSKMNFILAKPANVRITLMDISGKTVKVAANRNFSEGRNTINIAKGDLPEGIYIYKFFLNNNEINKSGKILVAD